MAFRFTKTWSSLLDRVRAAAYTSSTGPKLQAAAYAPAAGVAEAGRSPRLTKHGEFFPVYVALGLILLSATFGLHTVKQQLMHSPSVWVKKSRRETIPEVVEPEHVAEESKNFLNKSFFRRIAHIQDLDTGDTVIPDAIRKDAYAHQGRLETLKSVGVDPRA